MIHGKTSSPILTYTLMAVMVIVSLLAYIWPPLADVVGGVGELNYLWQPWTAVFLHGWPGMPLALHLGGNLVLLALIGPQIERQLGTGRFFLLTLAAIIAAGFVRLLTGVEFNGASAFIWAYAPPLWLLVRHNVQSDNAALLWVMWLIVPLVMGIILTLNGTNLLAALLWGNVYHLSGTALGFASAWFWQKRLIA